MKTVLTAALMLTAGLQDRLEEAVTLGGVRIKVEVLSTPAQRRGALERAAEADSFSPLLLRYPAARFHHLHTDELDRGYDLVFLSAEGKIVDKRTLPARSEKGVTSSKEATSVIVLRSGRLRRLAVHTGDSVTLPKLEAPKPMHTITFKDMDTKKHALTVELATTWDERGRGLMHRTRMSADGGMLFKYSEEDDHSYWMKNTHIPLALAFLRSDGTIRKIHTRMTPDNERLHYASEGPVQYALEAHAGWFAKHGISEGDRVIIPSAIIKMKAER